MTKQDIKNQLEQLIDRTGTFNVIEFISEIMYEKAQHLRENWQDEGQAKLWDKNAKAILNTLPKLKV